MDCSCTGSMRREWDIEMEKMVDCEGGREREKQERVDGVGSDDVVMVVWFMVCSGGGRVGWEVSGRQKAGQ